MASADVSALQNEENEPYAVLSEDNTVLTFYYDDQKAARNGMDVGPFYGYSDTEDDDDDFPSWNGQKESITKVVFDESFANCTTLTSTAYWFYGLKNLSSISGISNLKTDNVTDMKDMFDRCSSLTSLDLTGFKTENVTDMFGMFQNCRKLTSIDVSGFKTDKVTNMSAMFWGCSGLTSLDLTGFKTDNVMFIDNMFWGCSDLTTLDLSGFKTENVLYMIGLFSGCSCLKTIYVGDGWSTAKVTDGKDMFKDCTSLVGGAGTTFDATYTDNTYARIDGGASNPGYFTEKSTTDQEDVDEITIKEIGKTTWCSEYDLDFTNVEGIKAYTATGYNNITKTIWLTRVMEVPAGTGILVKGDAGTYKIPHAEVQSAYANWFVGNLGDAIKIAETDGDKTNYYLSGKDGTFVSVNGSANIGKNKAYLQLPTSVFGGTRSIGISYDDEDGTTSIKNLTPALTEGEGAWYTLQGQRVAKPGKGLYIRNGKKVIVR